MSREDKKLRKHVEEHNNRELRKANKHLSKVRAGAPKPPREKLHVLGTSDDELAEFADPVPHKKQTRKAPEDTPLLAGSVIEIGPGFCDVMSAAERLRCRSTSDTAVGDQVLFSPGRRRIEQVLPRRTVLSRPDPHNPRLERVIAANIDVVVNVVSLKSPPLRPGLIDRYLIAIGKSGAQPLLCVNKIDLLAGPEDLEPLRSYQEVGIPIIMCSAASGEGLDLLLEALAGKLCVFAGHSGVGKSSLLNALDPDLSLTTAAVSEGNDKGRHTTTSSTLYRLANGAIVIDTPGIREFGLWDVNKQDVRRYYREFDACPCAYSDCSHTHEPDCGVKAAASEGRIPASRYEGYLRILSSLG